ncbi:hypothetical protein AB0C52_22755 [Streptomyces sp. NPDC048717]|uniref:hypothetical protein n=1 Tax=Streptomyces sp. NPDC048717 TaxID=3154928 RepID=UPI003444915B
MPVPAPAPAPSSRSTGRPLPPEQPPTTQPATDSERPDAKQPAPERPDTERPATKGPDSKRPAAEQAAVTKQAAVTERPPAPERPTETTTRLRPIRDPRAAAATPRRTPAPPSPSPADPARPPARPVPAPRPGTAPAPGSPYDTWALAAQGQSQGRSQGHGQDSQGPVPAETTTRLRPVPGRRPGRVVAAATCAVLAAGLVGGAVTGALLADRGADERAEPPGFTPARALWHNAPVDTLFPRTLAGPAAGPGGAPRTWTRIVIAPDSPCSAATLPPKLYAALKAVGCDRVLRATYTDATSSQVTTVALAFTGADPAATRELASHAPDELPPALAGPGTVAEHFGAPQRASWWRHVLADLPVVVTTVSGFADGRTVAVPEPATRAMTPKRTSAVAQAGLGHEAKGVGDAVEQALRRTVAATAEEDQR